jgi:beta-lactamase class A
MQDFPRALAETPDVRWSVRAVDVATGRELCSHDATAALPTASVGKVLLLIETARQVEAGELDPAEPATRLAEDYVEDSGIWQFMATDSLCVADVAHLVGIMSDNLATNVLLRRVGLDRVQRTAGDLGLQHTRLNDRVRDHRGPQDPWTLSEGSAAEWVDLLARLSADAVVSAGVSRRVLAWLRAGADLSMVAQPLGLDPLAHAAGDRGMRLRHKTGTDDGTRADVGLVSGPAATVAYAAIAHWDPAGPDRRMPVLAAMPARGLTVLDTVCAAQTARPSASPDRPA